MCNGVLAGLVGITAGCSVTEPWTAIVCGFISAWVIHGAGKLLLKLKIDDPLEAAPMPQRAAPLASSGSVSWQRKNTSPKSTAAPRMRGCLLWRRRQFARRPSRRRHLHFPLGRRFARSLLLGVEENEHVENVSGRRRQLGLDESKHGEVRRTTWSWSLQCRRKCKKVDERRGRNKIHGTAIKSGVRW